MIIFSKIGTRKFKNLIKIIKIMETMISNNHIVMIQGHKIKILLIE